MSAIEPRSADHAYWDMIFHGWMLGQVAGLDPQNDFALDEKLGVLAVLGSGIEKLLKLPPDDPKLMALVEYLQATEKFARDADEREARP